MRIRVAVPEKYVEPTVINAALEAVTRVNHAMLMAGDVPPFDPKSPGVRWRPENMGDEHFDHAGIVLARGWGDCDDLAPWRAASLRATGEDPGATAVAVPSGPDMYHAIVRRSDGSNDDPSVAAGMKSKSVVGDGSQLLSVWACDPHDPGRIYQGSLAPTTSPLTPHCGPSFAVRPITANGTSVVGWEARVDCPVVGSRVARVKVRAHDRRFPRVHRSLLSGFAPYALSSTMGGEGWSAREACSVAAAGALHTGVAAGTMSLQDKYKLFALHRLLAGKHPSDLTIELAQMMHDDAKAAAVQTAKTHSKKGVHGCVTVGDFGSFLSSALGVVNDVAPALSAIPGVGPALTGAVQLVNSVVKKGAHPHGPAHGTSPQPQALAALHRPVPAAPGAPGTPPKKKPSPPKAPTPAAAANASQAAQTTPATAQAATAMNWDALSAMHQGGYRGSFGPFVVTFQ